MRELHQYRILIAQDVEYLRCIKECFCQFRVKHLSRKRNIVMGTKHILLYPTCNMVGIVLFVLSSNWLGYHPFKVKITGSSPVSMTKLKFLYIYIKNGLLAQLVQSICLLNKGSQVQALYKPRKKLQPLQLKGKVLSSLDSK